MSYSQLQFMKSPCLKSSTYKILIILIRVDRIKNTYAGLHMTSAYNIKNNYKYLAVLVF